MHGLIIAIEYSYMLDRKNYFNLWCELGRLLLRQSYLNIDHELFVTALLESIDSTSETKSEKCYIETACVFICVPVHVYACLYMCFETTSVVKLHAKDCVLGSACIKLGLYFWHFYV